MMRRESAWLAAVAVWLGALLWIRPLALPDEGRYVGVAWEMLRSGDWLTPTLDGLPFFHKPPLFYWLTAAALQVFGAHPWSARLASWLGALVTVGALRGFLRRRADQATADAATLVLATLPFLVGGSQYANMDMLVAGCITAAITAGADAALAVEAGQPHRRQVVLAWLAIGLGVLAKGLIGVVLPVGVLGLWLAWRRCGRAALALFWPPAWLVAAMIALPWFLVMQARFAGFLHYFFIVQHFQRFASEGFNNAQPVWFYPVVLLGLGLPWTLAFLWWGLEWRRPAWPTDAVSMLMACWGVGVVVFFSIPRSKLVGYVLPALPPLAFGLARLWLARGGPGLLHRLTAGSAALALAGIVAVAVKDDRSAAPLAGALHARRPGEPLLVVGQYPYDLPLLLRARAPLPVFLDWQDGAELRKDGWARELADAGRFAPVQAGMVLHPLEDLPVALCAMPVSWVVLGADAVAPAPLTAAAEVARTPRMRLLRLDVTTPERHLAACGRPG